MTWDAVHHRAEVLRRVVDEADRRRDGVLPLDLPGVTETFDDELALVSALQLRWHTRLAGHIERVLMDRPDDLETAVVVGWRETADELAGVRRILDAQRETPLSPELADALDTAHRKDAVLMAAMAGLASPSDPSAVRVGERIESAARAAYRPTAAPRHLAEGTSRPVGLLDRIRAILPAA